MASWPPGLALVCPLEGGQRTRAARSCVSPRCRAPVRSLSRRRRMQAERLSWGVSLRPGVGPGRLPGVSAGFWGMNASLTSKFRETTKPSMLGKG